MTRLEQILEGGDWACANQEGESLELVCKLLARNMPIAAGGAREIAWLARRDLAAATRRWGELGEALRRSHGTTYSSPPTTPAR